MSELDRLTAARRQAFENHLKSAIVAENDKQAKIVEAMNYSLLSAGKRLRALLLMEACQMAGGDQKEALPFAIAVEMIHAYSLIHDDLPAMDDDDLRRGQATNHIVYGEAMAILAGDGLLNYAYELILCALANTRHTPSALAAALTLAKASGYRDGMLNGQVLDIIAMQHNSESQVDLSDVHASKTAALLAAAVKAGAQLAGLSGSALGPYQDYGFHLGMAFQIIDDLLDITGDVTTLGKPIGSDTARQKMTYPAIYGLRAAQGMAQDHTARALASLSKIETRTAFIEDLTHALLTRHH